MWSSAAAGEGQEILGLGTTRTSGLRNFWAGYGKALRLLRAVCSALSLSFLSYVKLARVEGAWALGTAPLDGCLLSLGGLS